MITRKDLFAAFAMHALMQENFARLRNDELGQGFSPADIASDADAYADAMCRAETEKELAKAVRG